MKQEPYRDEISDELAGVLGRFNAWRTLNGSVADGDNGTLSWKLVYGEALESIERLNQRIHVPSPAPSLAVPASSGLFLLSSAPRLSDRLTTDRVSPRPVDVDASLSIFSPGPAAALYPRAAGIRIEEVGTSRAAKSKTSAHRNISVTVRMKPVEAIFVKRKAIEARVTISEYLRQCAAEVEKLGTEAMVMQIEIAQLRRSAAAVRTRVSSPSPRRGAGKFAQRALATR